jgi:hypothetical protein
MLSLYAHSSEVNISLKLITYYVNTKVFFLRRKYNNIIFISALRLDFALTPVVDQHQHPDPFQFSPSDFVLGDPEVRNCFEIYWAN